MCSSDLVLQASRVRLTHGAEHVPTFFVHFFRVQQKHLVRGRQGCVSVCVYVCLCVYVCVLGVK